MKIGANDLNLVTQYRQKVDGPGHCEVQYECGISAWNARHLGATNKLRAIYWLGLAEARRSVAAHEMLSLVRKVANETLTVPLDMFTGPCVDHRSMPVAGSMAV